MLEVELVGKVNLALDAYIDLYRGRYHTEPLNLGSVEQTILKDVVRKHGLEVCLGLLAHYLSLDGDKGWFATHAHSLRIFKDNLNVINTSLAMKKRRPATSLKGRLTEAYLACGSCWKYFYAVFDVNTDWPATFIRCPECLIKDSPLLYPEKEEFLKHWSSLDSEVTLGKYETRFPKKEPHPKQMTNLTYELKDSPYKWQEKSGTYYEAVP